MRRGQKVLASAAAGSVLVVAAMVACTSFGIGGESASNDGGTSSSVDGAQDESRPLADATASDAGAPTVYPACSTPDTVIVGVNAVSDGGPADIDSLAVDGYGYPFAITNDVVQCAYIYIMDPKKSGSANIGVYADVAGKPADLLANATFAPVLGWNHAQLDRPISLANRTALWIGLAAAMDMITIYVHHPPLCTTTNQLAQDQTKNGTLHDFFDASPSDYHLDHCLAAFYLSH